MSSSISPTTSVDPNKFEPPPDGSPDPSGLSSTASTSVLPFECTASGAEAEVEALFITSLREDRKHDRTSSDLEEIARMREGEMRVAELHEKADEIRSEGWARGISQIASAACGVYGGSAALNGTDSAASEAKLAMWSGGGKAFEGGGSILGNGFQAKATESQALADQHESISEGHKTARDRATDEASDAKQMIERLIQTGKEINDTRNATLLAAATLKA